MAQLFPLNFDLSALEQSEQRAIKLLMENLDVGWIVVPSVPITFRGQDREIDCILVSFDHGVFVMEIKGGIITVKEGAWKSTNHVIQNPVAQVMVAKHLLIKRLKVMKVDTDNIFINHVVAFPDIIAFPEEGAGPDCPRDIVMTKRELMDAAPFLLNLRRDRPSITSENVKQLLKALRPDISDIDVDGRQIKGTSQRIQKISKEQLSIVFGLDENKRVLLRGAAGTGKTYVASNWVSRAVLRGEKTLFVCYNRALGFELTRYLSDVADTLEDSTQLVTGSFHAVVNKILGDKPVMPPENATQEWWDTHHAQLLIDSAPHPDYQFDTIVVDEGQDFRPLWIEALHTLLKDPIHGRFLMTADESQALYTTPPTPTADTATLRLEVNVRNTRKIAEVLQTLGGAPVASSSPPGPKVDIYEIGGAKERRKSVVKALTKARDELGIPLSQMLVLVPHRKDRDELISEPLGDFTLCSWEERNEEQVACATIQGTKGLERMAVVFTSLDEEPDRRLTYIGASRATMYLAVIGRNTLISQLSKLTDKRDRDLRGLTSDTANDISDV